MKVLQLCNKPPFPPVDGGTMAMNCIATGLLDAGCTVKVLAVETDKHPACHADDPHALQAEMETVYIDLRAKPLPAAAAMLCGESYHVKRYISRTFADKLEQVLAHETFDVVHVESIFLTPYLPLIRRHTQADVVLRAHNVEHHIWHQLARCTRRPLLRSYYKHLALTLRAYELEHINDYDGIVCISRDDADFFLRHGCRRPIATVPFGVEPPTLPATDAADPCALFHIGSMDWLPNREGIGWLLKTVWPAIHRAAPAARLYLAGRKMPARWMNRQDDDGVTIEGEVESAADFIAGKQINIVPLLSGSGIRVKIVEAMSLGKTVITTAVGAQGIDYTDGENILIANTPDEFARHVSRCLDNPLRCRQIGEAAARLVRERYNTGTLTEQLITFYKRITQPQ